MKKETVIIGNTLLNQIDWVADMIKVLEEKDSSSYNRLMGFGSCPQSEIDEIRTIAIKHLNKKKKQYEAELDRLK